MIDFERILDPDQLTNFVIAFAPKVLAALVIMFMFWLLLRLTRPALRNMLKRAALHDTLVHMLVDNLYGTVIWIIGVVTALGQMGVNVTAALAGMGVVGVALGFAAQDTVANMIAGFLIFWDKPFLVRDYVTVADQYGRVVEITMRSTRIRTQQNTYVVIPNKQILDTVMVNHSKHGEVRVEIPVGIAYKESIPEARRVMLEALKSIEILASSPEPDIVCSALGASSVDLLVRVWVKDSELERQAFFQTIEACKLALDKAGIQIPYHHLQLFIDDVEDRVWQKAGRLITAGAQGGGHAA